MISSTTRLALGYTSMLLHATTRGDLLREPAVRDALARQIHFTGVQAVPYVAAVAALFGAGLMTWVLSLLGSDNDAVLKTVLWGGIRELAPLVTALIIIVRSGVAIAAEVALMRLGQVSEHGRAHDLQAEERLVLPRVLGAAISGLALVSCFQFMAIASALLASAWLLGTDLASEVAAFLGSASVLQVPLSMAKGLLFGAGIAAISCHHGLQVGDNIKALPKVVVAACAGSLTFVLVVDAVAMALLLL